jgi:hypothetical protein
VQAEGRLSSTAVAILRTPAGTIYIEFPKIHLRIESGADGALLRVMLESLAR